MKFFPRPQAPGWRVFLFSCSVFLYWIALYLYVPTLPIYVKQFSPNLGAVGVVLSMYGLWQALARFPIGLASDWLGRSQPFIFIGFGLTALGPWILGSASSLGWLGAGRAVTGLAAATWVPIVVVFSRFFSPQETIRATALLTMVGAGGRILATSATGFLNARGGFALAFQLAALAAVLSMLLLLPVSERPRALRKPALTPVRRLVGQPHVLYPALLNAMAQVVNFGLTFGFMPILAANLGAGDVEVSLLISINMVLTLAGNSATALTAHKLRARTLIKSEFLILGAGSLLAAWAPALGWLYVAQAFIGLATGIGYPTLLGLSIRHVGDEERSAAMGLHQSVYGFGMFGGPFIAGFLADGIGLPATFTVLASLCFLVLIPQLLGRLLIDDDVPPLRR